MVIACPRTLPDRDLFNKSRVLAGPRGPVGSCLNRCARLV